MDEAPSGDSLLQLLAQLADVDVDRTIGLAIGLAPDLAIELLARDDAVAPLHEGGQQLELADREMEALAVHQHQELAGPHLHLAGPEGRPLRRCLHGRESSSIVRNV